MNLKVSFVLTAISIMTANTCFAGPSNKMNCKLQLAEGLGDGECTMRCKDCYEPECVDLSKECSPTITPTDCDAGKYGTLLCQDCPPDTVTHANVTSDKFLNIAITGCYIPKNSSFYDDTGDGTYTGNCNYTE